MNKLEIKRISKFLSLILRHNPQTIGLELDKNGWADINELMTKAKRKRIHFTRDQLDVVVEMNDKKRFAFDETNTKIRANQGHSIKHIDLEMKPIEPPQFLYHGTVGKFIALIKADGLIKMNRQHVHLSQDRETAVKVGSRRGKPIILSIRSLEMHSEGFQFFRSENGVWLTDNIPSKYIEFKS